MLYLSRLTACLHVYYYTTLKANLGCAAPARRSALLVKNHWAAEQAVTSSHRDCHFDHEFDKLLARPILNGGTK